MNTTWARRALPVLLVLLLQVLYPAGRARAQEDEEFDEEFELLEEEQTVYTASRHEQSISDSPATVTVITRRQIENTHCTNVVCLLRQVPEVEVRRMGPMHHSVGARALASEMNDKVLLLVDGREDNFESLGMPFWAILDLHLDDIERIEVVRGPGSALYGANAHSLVVNIITRRAQRNLAEVFLGAGEHGRQNLGGRLHRVWEDWHLALSAGRETADAFEQRGRKMRETNWLALRLDRDIGDSSLSLDSSFLHGQGLLVINFAPTYMTGLNIARAMLQFRGGLLRAHLWYQLFEVTNDFDLPLYYNNTLLGQMPQGSEIANHSVDGEVQLTHSFFSGNLLVAGANYRWLGLFWPDNDPEAVYQHRVGFFVQDEQRLWEKLLLVAAVRLDYNSITPFTVSPRAAVVWRPTAEHALRFHFGRAFRKPSFFNTSTHLKTIVPAPGFPEITEFFHQSLGNEDLKNESVTAFEIGYRGSFLSGALSVQADAFYNLYRNAIVFAFNMEEDNFGLPDLSRSWIRFENEGVDVDTVGGSLALQWQPWTWLELRANYTYRYSRYTNQVPSPLMKKGDRVPWEPAQLFNLAADLNLESGLRAGMALFARSGLSEFWTADGGLFGQEVMVPDPARFMLGGYLSWRLSCGSNWLEAGLRVFDLLGEKWRDLTGVVRFDGVPTGGQWMNRLVTLFLRGGF